MNQITTGEFINLNNNQEYLCALDFNVDEKHYLYLVTTGKPTQIVFAEQQEGQIRIINNPQEKQSLAKILGEKVAKILPIDESRTQKGQQNG